MQGTTQGRRRAWPIVLAIVVVGIVAWWVFARDDFYMTDENWDHGVSRGWPGYYVTAEAVDHAPGRVVKLGNGETRRITLVEMKPPYRNVHVAGKVLDPKVNGHPKDYTIQEAGAVPAVEDPFLVTDTFWDRSVSRKEAGFFVSAEDSRGFAVGRSVVFKNGEARKIARAERKGPYLNVYVEGAPLDPAVHGIPSEYSVR